MKKEVVFFIFLVFFLLTSAAGAEDSFVNPVYSDEFISAQMELLSRAEQIFPRPLIWERFDTPSKPSVSKDEAGLYYYNRISSGKMEFMVSADKPMSEQKGRGSSYFTVTGSYQNFYMSIEGQIIECDDSKSDYLWIQYTDDDTDDEKERSSVSIDFPVKIEKYETVNGKRIYTQFYDLSAYADDYGEHLFEIIRLDGITNIYIDKNFIVQFEDGLNGRFYNVFGTGLGIGGTYSAARFDNYKLWKQ